MQWEYYVKDFKFDENQIEDGFPNKLEHDDLAHLGNAGWDKQNNCVDHVYSMERID